MAISSRSEGIPVVQKQGHVLLVEGCRWLLVVSLVLAVVGKLTSYAELLDALKVSRLIPDFFTKAVAWGLIGWEALLAFLLCRPSTVFKGVRLVIPTLLVFIAYHGWRNYNGIKAPCSCFGVLYTLNPANAIGLTIVLLIAATLVAAKYLPAKS